MTYKIVLKEEADDDLSKLSHSQKILIFKQLRIVYQIIDDKIIVEIIAIGKRDDMDVYKKASDRL